MFTVKLISAVTASGFIFGAAFSGLVPTEMREGPQEWWRAKLELRKSPEAVSYTFIDTGPQDLSPDLPTIRERRIARLQAAEMPEPAYAPSGYEGFRIEPPVELPRAEVPDASQANEPQVRVIRGGVPDGLPAAEPTGGPSQTT